MVTLESNLRWTTDAMIENERADKSFAILIRLQCCRTQEESEKKPTCWRQKCKEIRLVILTINLVINSEHTLHLNTLSI